MAKRTEAGLPVLRMRPIPKGRAFDARALEEVRALLGDAPRTRDLLIEHLHRIQDAYGRLSDAHLLGLAREMGLTAAEVYEVATFYHHFDVVKDDATDPPAVTIRVCDSIACEMAGSKAVLEGLRERLGDRVRVLAAPCIGRCDAAPAAFVGWRAVDHATVEAVEAAALEGAVTPEVPGYRDYAGARAAGGYARLQECVGGALGVAVLVRPTNLVLLLPLALVRLEAVLSRYQEDATPKESAAEIPQA